MRLWIKIWFLKWQNSLCTLVVVCNVSFVVLHGWIHCGRERDIFLYSWPNPSVSSIAKSSFSFSCSKLLYGGKSSLLKLKKISKNPVIEFESKTRNSHCIQVWHDFHPTHYYLTLKHHSLIWFTSRMLPWIWTTHQVWLRGSQVSFPTFSMQNFWGPLLPTETERKMVNKINHCKYLN